MIGSAFEFCANSGLSCDLTFCRDSKRLRISIVAWREPEREVLLSLKSTGTEIEKAIMDCALKVLGDQD